MIFVTVGSQKFQFNRLLKQMDILIAEKEVTEEVFAQIGASDYRPKFYSFKEFLDKDEFEQRIDNCDLVITHGGTGTIITAVKKGKKVIASPRLTSYGEHVDDHQLQLLRQFDELEIIEVCENLDKLIECIEEAKRKVYRKYRSNTTMILKSIEYFLEH